MNKKVIILFSILCLLLLSGQGALAYLYWVRPPGSTQIVTVVKDPTAIDAASGHGADTATGDTPASKDSQPFKVKLDKFTTNLSDAGARQRYAMVDVTLDFTVTTKTAKEEQDKITGTIPAIRSVILEQLRAMTTADLLAPDASTQLAVRLTQAVKPQAKGLSKVYITDLIVQ